MSFDRNEADLATHSSMHIYTSFGTVQVYDTFLQYIICKLAPILYYRGHLYSRPKLV